MADTAAVGAPFSSLGPDSMPSSKDPKQNLTPSDIHVLLVDDERLSRVVVGNLLRKCSYKVTVAESGSEALDILRSSPPGTFQLVLTDVMMPDVDGIELLRFLRSNSSFNNMPVVMMSANEHTDTVFECIRCGAENYLLKPVTKKEVQYIWQHVWRRQQQGQVRVPHMGQDEGEEFRNATQSVPSAPLPFMGSQLDPTPPGSPALPQEYIKELPTGQQQQPAIQTASALQLQSQPNQAAASINRQQSGALAGSSGRAHGAGTAHSVLMSQYFARRGTSLNSKHSFKLFCQVLALLQPCHANGVAVGAVRPSSLRIALGTGLLSFDVSIASAIESHLYASPEEVLSGTRSIKSDVYSLGVLFFELFNPIIDPVERAKVLGELRHRFLPMDMLRCRPQEAAFVCSLVHPDPSLRPSVEEILRSDALRALHRNIMLDQPSSVVQPVAAAALPVPLQTPATEEDLDNEVLMDFLKHLTDVKRVEQEKIRHELAGLDVDISQVGETLLSLIAEQEDPSEEMQSALAGVAEAVANGSLAAGASSALLSINGQLATSANPKPAKGASRKRRRLSESRSSSSQELQALPWGNETAESKWNRVSAVFPQLEEAFFQRRQHADDGASSQGSSSSHVSGHLLSFSEDLSRFSRYQQLKVKATLKYGDLLNATDMVCSTAFDRDDEFFATAGVSRRIKIFEVASVLDSDVSIHYPVLEIPSRCKLSSVCWNSYIKSNLVCADYEGVLQLWDCSTNTEVMQYEEHSKRVWSVDFSLTDPTRFVSGSDDGTVKLWNMNEEASFATIDSKANVCSIQFSPTDSNLVAFGSANYRIYMYDLRNISAPLGVIDGHDKAVSYVRFLSENKLVSASTDNSLKLWDINRALAAPQRKSVAADVTFKGHTNERNFVGLSVSPEGYIACGSEDNAVYSYYQAMPIPLTSHKFGMADPITGQETDVNDAHQFVSSVCWSRSGHALVAANSMGHIKVLELA